MQSQLEFYRSDVFGKQNKPASLALVQTLRMACLQQIIVIDHLSIFSKSHEDQVDVENCPRKLEQGIHIIKDGLSHHTFLFAAVSRPWLCSMLARLCQPPLSKLYQGMHGKSIHGKSLAQLTTCSDLRSAAFYTSEGFCRTAYTPKTSRWSCASRPA
ncbi:hypothetical protein BKA81DRAFT_49753 [Phyllosticta paracitricarpa]